MILIILGIILVVVAFIISLNDENSNIFIWFACLWGSMLILVGILSRIPTAMDLHAGNAVIKYEIVDGVKVDSTFVFKDK